jgi:hypothetical protein
MGPQRLRHHPEGGAGSGGDTGERSSVRVPAPGERRQLRSDGRRRKEGGRARERARLCAARRRTRRRYRRGGAVGRRRRGLQGRVGAGLNQWESVRIQQRRRLNPLSLPRKRSARGRRARRRASALPCNHRDLMPAWEFYGTSIEQTLRQKYRRAVFFSFRRPRGRVFQENTPARPRRARGICRLSSFSLDPTGVHFASNHDCRLDRPTRDRA